MSWKTDLAIKRIFNSFKRLKNQIFTQDIDALKTLKEEIENSQKEYVNDNILFLKLLSIHLKTELDYFKDVNFAKKNIHKALSLPLSYHVEMLKMSLQQSDYENYAKEIGLSLDLFANKETKEKDKEILNKNQKEIIEKLKRVWDTKKIEQSLYNTANEFLKDVENYS